MSSNSEILAKRVKYLYMDVVGFTRNRSIECQSHIVKMLNEIVKKSVSGHGIAEGDILYLPTGDGLGIALLNNDAPYDLHINLALLILKNIHEYNESTEDPMRKFNVRIGINENVDNIITDINDNTNVAGAGINMAQRVMSLADGRQLLVGQIVFETLTYRERYMRAFRSYRASIKHNISVPVHQFIEEGHDGLSINTPSIFTPVTPEKRRFSEIEAFYIGLAIKHRDFLIRNSGSGQRNYALVVLLWFMANDAAGERRASEFDPYDPHIFGRGNLSLQESFDYYMSIDFWVCCELQSYVKAQLSNIAPYLGFSGGSYYIVKESGREKLLSEFPEIAIQLKLDGAPEKS